jgi:hypothetical protein
MAEEESDPTAAFLAMSWEVPPELEMPPELELPPALFTPTAAAVFPPQPPVDVEELTHSELYVAVIRWHTPITHTELYVAVIRWHTPLTHRVVCSGHPMASS